MKKSAVLIVSLVSLVSLAAATGCRTNYGAGCEKEAGLTAPWTELGLPIDEDETRVCASSAQELKLRSSSWKSAGEAQPAFEKALAAAGYAKERCNAQACYYERGGQSIGVHPMEFKVKKSTLITVVLSVRDKPSRAAR
jgi:hypothetical protein